MVISSESEFRFSDPPQARQRYLNSDQNIVNQWPFPELTDFLPDGVFQDVHDPDLLPPLVRVGAKILRGDIHLERGFGKHSYRELWPYVDEDVASRVLEAVKVVHNAMKTEPYLVEYFNLYWFGSTHYFRPDGNPRPQVPKEVQIFVVFQAEKLRIDSQPIRDSV